MDKAAWRAAVHGIAKNQLSTHTHWEIKPGSGVPVQCFFIVRMELDTFPHLISYHTFHKFVFVPFGAMRIK